MYKFTDKDKDLLVKLISSGKNTYKDLQAAFPEFNEWQFIGGAKREPYHDLIKLDKTFAEDEVWNYKVADNDTFHLTKYGEDWLYKVQKEESLLRRQDESIKWAQYAVFVGAISAVAAIITIIITILG